MRTLLKVLVLVFLLAIAAIQAVWLWAAWKVQLDGAAISSFWPLVTLAISLVLAMGTLAEMLSPGVSAEPPSTLETTRDIQRRPKLKFSVKRGKRYKAQISLSFFEQVAGNDTIAGMFAKAGFSEVSVTGNGATRYAEGRWAGADATAEMPAQIVSATELADAPPQPPTSSSA